MSAEPIPLRAEMEPAPMFSLEAEMSVLGGMLVDPSAAPRAAALLEPWHFYRQPHQVLYSAMLALDHRGEPVEPVVLSEHLKAEGVFEQVGGAAYLAQLWDYIPTASNLEYHAKIVLRHATRRRLMAGTAAVQQMLRDQVESEPERLQAEAERIIADAAPKKLCGDLVLVRDLLLPEFEKLERMENDPDFDAGISTGLEAVDERLGGMHPGQLVVVAGRPSMGKSAYAICNLAADAAIRQRRRTVVFSVESTRDEVARRLLASESRVNLQAARRRRQVADHEYPQLAQGSGLLNPAPLHVDHTPGLSVDQMRVKLRQLNHEHADDPVQFAVVDYLQMMVQPGSRSRYDEVSDISRGLKRVAQEFGIVVVALSQLSRKVEDRPSKRPQMSDLRESGQLEQDADVVKLLFRPEYYFGATDKDGNSLEGKAEVIIGKARDGETGNAAVIWEGEYTHFTDYRHAGGAQ